jgi:hypothetical protein
MRRILVALVVACLPVALAAQVTGRNVNMVSGTTLPNGDPFLQRQNEPSIAVSTRNPLHLLAGANDYRTVDLPGLPNSNETGDAWMGLFMSSDGGATWKTGLLPGYPQENPSSSPLKGYAAAADPVVRAGTNGLFYYSGIVFDRGSNVKSAMFVARLIDNNVDTNNPIAYVDTKLIATNPGTAFIDKPWIVVDVPRAGAETCSFTTTHTRPDGTTRQVTQTFPGGAVYAAYSLISGAEPDVRSQIYLSRSTNCGATWSLPQQISSINDPINQGAALAIDPRNGTLYLAWRRFSADGTDDSIMVTRSMDQGRKWDPPGRARRFPRGRKVGLQQQIHGKKFKKPVELADLTSLDQPTQPDRFRSNAYPTMTVDETGRVYVAWAERGFSPINPNPDIGDARILIATSTNGAAWTEPQTVDNGMTAGHQLMPSMTYSGGKLMIAYYDLREDVSQVFGQWVDETSAIIGANKRHTVDIRAAEATPGAAPTFRASVRVSEYLYGTRTKDAPGTDPYQLQYNPPNLKLFALGTVPFMGDYIDLTPSPAFVPTAGGGWTFNTAAASSPLYHVTWTDNRDVIPPSDGNWANYVPPTQPGADPNATRNSFYSPGTVVPACTADAKGNTRAGMRNQNIYTARITGGLIAGAPDNSKPLDPNVQRTFVVYAQNTSNIVRSFRLTIDNQPAGGRASFSQLPLPPYTAASPAPLTVLDVNVPIRSTVARTVYATSTDPAAQVRVTIEEIAGAGGTPVDGGLETVVVLNPDISNPDISNPDISNPDISNPDISNPDISNPDISNPDISNPDISNPDISNPDISNVQVANPDISNPDISNPDISNPDISNPDISNPDISNPDISNPDISNQSLTDTTWTVTNNGTSPTAYNVELLLNGAAPAREDIVLQLILHKRYLTPSVVGCGLVNHTTNVLLANINNPDFATLDEIQNPDISNPDISNATLWLGPGESAQITVRTLDVDIHDDVVFNADQQITPIVVSQPANVVDGVLDRPIAAPPVQFLQVDLLAFTNEPLETTVVSVRDGDAAPVPNSNVTLRTFALPDTETAVQTFNGVTGPDGLVQFQTGALKAAGKYRMRAVATHPNLPTSSVWSSDITIAVPPPIGLVVTNTNDAGAGSLRAAIAEANRRFPSIDTISFAIPGTGPHVIAPTSALPALSDSVVLQGGACGVAPAVEINGASAGVAPGLVLTGGNSIVRGLSITGFQGNGIEVRSNGNTVECSYVGLAPDGTTAKGNGANGIHLIDAGSNIIGGGTSPNVVSANGAEGIRLDGTPTTGNTIAGNYIGTEASGTAARGNTNSGIYVRRAPANTIRGNVVSGNNGFAGIAICGETETVCGAIPVGTPTNFAAGNIVAGNKVGVDAPAQKRLANAGYGISIDGAPGTIVGGTTANDGNVIGANSTGVVIFNAGADDTIVRGNYIGTNTGGTINLGNVGAGVLIARGVNSIVSGLDSNRTAPNTIAFNGGAGIEVTGGSGHKLRINRIDNNGGLGIDLGVTGVDRIDPGDADGGANTLQNAPGILSAHVTGTTVAVGVNLSSSPGTTFTVDLYVSPACDVSGFGEGAQWFGAFTATTDANGAFSTNIGFGGVVTPGQAITATVTNGDFVTAPDVGTGNTSEFSNCAIATTGNVFQWTTAAGGNDHLYEYVLSPGITWSAANTAAQAASFAGLPGNLASVSTAAENTFIAGLQGRMGLADLRAWIGLFDATGDFSWTWTDGTAPGFFIWGVNEPNNVGRERWVEMFSGGAWNNNVDAGDPVFPPQGYIVEYARPPIFL